VPSADTAREQQLRELGLAFRGAFRSLRSLRGRDTHTAGELGHAQFELLGELAERGPLSVGELAAAAGLSSATVSPMLDQLEERGHVARARARTDGRVVVAELTPLGRRTLDARKAMWRARWLEELDGVSPEELAIAASVLTRIGAIFRQPPPALPS
jgi:DNA-binding MarR family transcriptional regulator